MPRILEILAIVFSIVLFPPAALALISNNAVPGDMAYPVKRVMEDGIFAVVSVNQTSRAWFAAARSDRRFKEFSSLLARGEFEGKTLDELVAQTKSRSEQLGQITDLKQRRELIADLSKSIDEYNQGLKKAEEKTSLPTKQQVTTQTALAPSSSPVTPQSSVAPTDAPKISPTPVKPKVTAPPQITSRTIEEQAKLREQQRQLDQAKAEFEYLQKVMEEERRRTEELIRQLEEQKMPRVSPVPSPVASEQPNIAPSPSGTKRRLFDDPVSQLNIDNKNTR